MRWYNERHKYQEGGVVIVSDQPKKRIGVSGVAVPAGLFIGMGIGFLVDELVAGMFIGLGGGFLGLIILRLTLGDW